ncbi:MAG TPA: FimV/HubP family polar landmark protein, partial [Gammaproteobacteria bacterium]|nr:FimV/HubP family polar landmark protein [Gammaproteobacteria bacterium]
MFRTTAVAAALLFITISSNVSALGLGEIDMQSALNQPLQANIGLTSAAGVDLSQVKVGIASAEAHQRAGLNRPRALGKLRFQVERDSSGRAVIRVSSTDNIREPFLEFMLELSWPNGRLMRQYTVLVDPPLTMPAAPAIPAAPVSTTLRATPVAEAPARRYRSPGTTGAARPPAAPTTGQSASSYGPVKRSETLWSIAKNVRPDNGVSMEQMMIALLRANPNAFVDNNINSLMAGATLRIPSRDEIASISAETARNEVNQQSRAWSQAQSGVQEPVAEESAAAVAAQAEPAPETVVTTESKLQLTPPEDDVSQGGATAGDPLAGEAETGSRDIEQQLALASETAEANRAQSEELQSRLTELEDQLVTMKRLLELKNDQLASMQNQQATAAAAAENPPPAELEQPVAADEAQTVAQDNAETEAAASNKAPDSDGIVNKLMDNPILAGLGVLVAMLLG